MTNGPDVSGVLTDLTQTAAPRPPSAKKTRPGDKAEGPTETLGTREQLRRCWHPVTLALRLVFSICTKLFPVSDSSRWVVPEHRRSFPGPQGVCVCGGGGGPGRPAGSRHRQGLSKGAAGCLSLAERAVHQRQRRAVAMVMDQPQKGPGSRLLDKLVLKSAYYQKLKKVEASILEAGLGRKSSLSLPSNLSVSESRKATDIPSTASSEQGVTVSGFSCGGDPERQGYPVMQQAKPG